METLHKGHRERLRQKMIKNGIESLAPHEMLECLLFYAIPRRDTNPIAHKLLNKYNGNISRVFDADIDELKTVDGIGENAALLIHLIPQLMRVYNISHMKKGESLGTAEKLGEFAINLCVGKTNEELIVICLDSDRRLKTYSVLEKGTVNEVSIYTRKVAEYAIREKAVNIVLAHNHPNGSPVPSSEDKAITMNIIRALGVLSLNVIDHIIVAGNRYYSMKEMGDIK